MRNFLHIIVTTAVLFTTTVSFAMSDPQCPPLNQIRNSTFDHSGPDKRFDLWVFMTSVPDEKTPVAAVVVQSTEKNDAERKKDDALHNDPNIHEGVYSKVAEACVYLGHPCDKDMSRCRFPYIAWAPN